MESSVSRPLFVVLALAAFIVSEVAVASKVTRINRKQNIVQMDSGTNDGFAKGTRVCIFGRRDARITCGVIVRSAASQATVRVRSNIEKVRRGMEVRVSQPPGRSTSTVASMGQHRRNIKAHYMFTLMSPATYNKLIYEAPTTSGEVNSLWSPSEAAGMSIFGVGGEFEYPISTYFSLAVGARFRMHRGLVAEADYDKVTPDDKLYAKMNQTGSAMGFWLDTYLYDLKFSDSMMLRFSTGLDAEMSKTTLKADRLSEKPNPEEFVIADVSSSATVLSMRFGSHFNVLFHPFGVYATANLLVPLTTLGESFSGTSADPNEQVLANGKEMLDNIREEIGHTAGSLGVEFLIGTSFAF